MIYDGDAPAASTNAGREREREVTNCELSDRDTRELDLQNPTMFDTSSFDYYERSNGRSGSDTDCLDGKSPLRMVQRNKSVCHCWPECVYSSIYVSFLSVRSCQSLLRAVEPQFTRNTQRIATIAVSQTCNEDGMEFTLRTPEGFYGRIYTYGFYDR